MGHGVDRAVGGSRAREKFNGVIDGTRGRVRKREIFRGEDVGEGMEEGGEPRWFGRWGGLGVDGVEVEGEDLVFVAYGMSKGGEGK